ncbi:MAG: hypothetical protein E6614_01920 [Bradyrhizobium sp.]|uniref:hypothetical protein n=4 Tax=Nitrobacteraceae TaxID=41294 RepID=UPI00155515C6|nr:MULTISPECIES: hypothetical protein [unclassified Bradyrhizobium]MDU1497540.1 hypothetical protein [Bradyrhizobium sp.]MDU1547782.1 hypothetical protein [Bradyrhizobium sp.]MDU1671257.1 hypothetical protein [Bradyrhizobium sp.]MDU1689337.1 hypothetical protein [Bradyrhizobium sp.]MDU1809234.1 hypothetical protein [Bradyrhizobium sp.]
MHNLPRTLEKIKKLAAACRAEIEASDRPLDAMPVQWVLPFFFVHPNRAEGWWLHVGPEVWARIGRLKQEPESLIVTEAELQKTPFALSHAEMQQFRNGPMLRMLSLVDLRLARQRGGRLKRHVELAIREALELEVFRRDPEIGALLSCMQAQFDHVDVPVIRGAGLNTLAELAWVPGIPTKRKAADDSLSEEDRRLALFETLRAEGEKLAVGRLPGLSEPAEAEAAVIAQIRALAGTSRSRAEFEDAIEAAANWVHTLAKACVHTKDVAEEKHQLAKRAKDVEALKRPPKGNNPFHQEPMTRQQHELFTRNEFSALELAFIAVAADVDPNLITINHVLATPEFRLARKLGQIGRGHQAVVLDSEEIKDLNELILGEQGHAEGAMYREVHRYLAECTLDILALPGGRDRLNDAIAQGQELAVAD